MLQKLLGLDSVSNAYSLLSERGILSGFYIGTIGFGTILGNSASPINSELYGWLAVICFVFGLIIGNISYEALLPLYRLMTERVERNSLYKTAKGDSKEKFPTHEEIRIFRENFIAAPGADNIKAKIIKDQEIRIALSYLNSASIVGFLVLFIAYHFYSVYPSVINLEIMVNSFIFIMTFIGKFPRTAAIGRDIGIAYLYTLRTKQDSKSNNSEHPVKTKI